MDKRGALKNRWPRRSAPPTPWPQGGSIAFSGGVEGPLAARPWRLSEAAMAAAWATPSAKPPTASPDAAGGANGCVGAGFACERVSGLWRFK
ncbi:hypothetical protein PAGU2638_23130 [Lysobacter sp. PAGU 2638]